MSLMPVFYIMPYKHHAFSIQGVIRNKGSFNCHQIMTDLPVLQWGFNKRSPGSESFSHRDNLCLVVYAMESGTTTNKKQLKSLDSYFRKLHCDSSNWEIQQVKTSVRNKADKELEILNDYLEKLDNQDSGVNSEDYVSSTFDDQMTERNHTPLPVRRSFPVNDGKEMKSLRVIRSTDGQSLLQEREALHQHNEISDLYLIGVLASINIAVFLFEIASPVKNSELGLFSLPLLYGAKINDLIMVGEWWRLLTPMFLHSGLVHVALGCWSLLTFGPQVCRGYGSFTFFLIYLLGGISGNLTSFLHTPAPTVGGTGPVFAIIGSWLIYQSQNKDETTKDVSDELFQKAMVITGICFILSHFGPVDDWTHLGATFTGVGYGYLTCPTLQLEDASSTTGQEEGIRVIRKHADPCKSVALFSLVVLVLSSLLFFIEPPLTMPASYDSLL